MPINNMFLSGNSFYNSIIESSDRLAAVLPCDSPATGIHHYLSIVPYKMAEGSLQSIPYQYPGAHKYKGKVYTGRIPESILKKIEEEAVWPKDTVIIATYPKSGTFNHQRLAVERNVVTMLCVLGNIQMTPMTNVLCLIFGCILHVMWC